MPAWALSLLGAGGAGLLSGFFLARSIYAARAGSATSQAARFIAERASMQRQRDGFAEHLRTSTMEHRLEVTRLHALIVRKEARLASLENLLETCEDMDTLRARARVAGARLSLVSDPDNSGPNRS